MAQKRRVAVVFRSYAKTPDTVNEVVRRARKSANKARLLDGVEHAVLVVPTDHDCGETGAALCEMLAEHSITLRNATLFQAQGHHSCGALNATVDLLDKAGYSHVAMVSNKAASFLTDAFLAHASEAFDAGAHVVGGAIDSLADIVRTGCVQNTLAVWRIDSLRAVGGFENETGVEEIAPLARLVSRHGRCIAVLEPSGGELDIRTSADGQQRHREVMENKAHFQWREMIRLGVSRDFARQGLLPGYPKNI